MIDGGIGDLVGWVGVVEFGEILLWALSFEDEEATLADLGVELESMSDTVVLVF